MDHMIIIKSYFVSNDSIPSEKNAENDNDVDDDAKGLFVASSRDFFAYTVTKLQFANNH